MDRRRPPLSRAPVGDMSAQRECEAFTRPRKPDRRCAVVAVRGTCARACVCVCELPHAVAAARVHPLLWPTCCVCGYKSQPHASAILRVGERCPSWPLHAWRRGGERARAAVLARLHVHMRTRAPMQGGPSQWNCC